MLRTKPTTNHKRTERKDSCDLYIISFIYPFPILGIGLIKIGCASALRFIMITNNTKVINTVSKS